jgi:glycosyltransferase involved in cell wall biosynthesis
VRVGIDCRALFEPATGIGTYARNLIAGLSQVDRETAYILNCLCARYRPKELHAAGISGRKNFRPVCGRIPGRLQEILGEWIRFPLERLLGPMDLYHATDYLPPKLAGAGLVATIHDLSFLLYPESFAPGTLRTLKRRTDRLIRRARIIVADSRCTAADLVRLCGVEENRIRVVYPACDPIFLRDERKPGADWNLKNERTPRARRRRRLGDDRKPGGEPSESVQIRYRLPARYILYVGALHPRKNLDRLVAAFARLKQGGYPQKLLIVTGKRTFRKYLLLHARGLGLREEIRILERVPRSHLPELYRRADLFVYPSLYEGFGYPVLEAMACGTPVVATERSSIPELTGKAALLVDPEDEDGMAREMARLLDDAGLRKSLGGEGRERARTFHRRRFAGEMIAVYREAARSGS